LRIQRVLRRELRRLACPRADVPEEAKATPFTRGRRGRHASSKKKIDTMIEDVRPPSASVQVFRDTGRP